MNNLFSTKSAKKTLFSRAYITATSQDLIKEIICKLHPELSKLNQEQSYNIFIRNTPELFEITLCSQNTHVLTLFKLNLDEIKKEIANALIDKMIIVSHDHLKIKIYFK
jgi:hypothetical protein